MIGIIFQLGAETVEVRLTGTNLIFRTQQTGGGFLPLESLQLNKKGVIKEFPDLEKDSQWKIKALDRLKEKLKTFNTENERAEYVIKDLSKFGWYPLYKQRKGFRPEKIG